ncbi:MAG TPA: alkene reductase [Puia sp.]|nr:alkene reductase [Puia sp.]
MDTIIQPIGPVTGSKLFSPAQLGPYTLSHRVVMAPLTRMRTVKRFIPNDLMAEYYAQRATPGGYIIAEGTVVHPTGDGYFKAPGIFTEEQAEAWKRVTEAVHKKDARIFLQLYHVGRRSHTSLLPDGAVPVGPSVIPFEDLVVTPDGRAPVSPNRALRIGEIHALADAFGTAARYAMKAGFDGVELHGANGYLIDQFLQDGANHRTDEYGGSIGNRVRFLLEVVDAMVSVWGGNRVGVRLSPSGTWGAIFDSNPVALFDYAVEKLNRFGLAYLHIIEPRILGSYRAELAIQEPIAAERLRKIFKGTIIAAGGFDRDGAEAVLKKGDADLVAFGRYFVANPDLPLRFREGLPLNPYDRATFYGGDERGYTDYSFWLK